MKMILMAATLALTAIASPMAASAADTPVYNSAPADGFHYGSGNDYSPANAAVLTTTSGDELALRFHVYQQAALPSDLSGVYSFALGSNVSFDWSLDGNLDNALITLTNVGTGFTTSYNPFFVGNDNYTGGSNDPDLAQNSARLSFASLLGSNFTPNVDSTYSATLTTNGSSLTAFAQLGAGAPAVPEPATWAMMLLGFGGIGFSMRRKRGQATLAQLA